MLSFLKIKNFALMESLEIEFGPGLIVLTGETGAGKSIIIQALSALLGQKMDETVIRTGSESAEVEGLFKIDRGSIDRLRSAGIETEGEIIIKRVIGRGRRQSSYINNSLASISLLKEIGERLVDLHGQHEHQSLLNVANHIDLLDSYGGLEPERLALAQTLNQYQSTIRELEETVTEVNLIKTKIDLLQYQIDEIKKAQLKPGEDEELRKERDLISSAARRAELSEELIKLLYEEENSILTRLEIALKLLNQLTALDPSLGELNNEAEKTKIQLAEIHRTIFNYHSKIDLSRERLDEVNGRLDLIARLKKKYGSTIEEILNYYEKIKAEVERISYSEERVEGLKKRADELKVHLNQQAIALSEKRARIFPRLSREIERHLKELGMDKARFKIVNCPIEDPDGIVHHNGRGYKTTDVGIDRIEFYIAPNIGEDAKPLNKIASGGEISRIMLALKTVLAENDRVPVMVFDEIDVGIGGRVAETLGKKLSNLGKIRQIICITHLPQIAKYADTHYLVSKETSQGRTNTRIRRLNFEERINELARMLGGEKITSRALAHARELLGERE